MTANNNINNSNVTPWLVIWSCLLLAVVVFLTAETTAATNHDRSTDKNIRIASFNVQIFGVRKAKNPEIMKTLVRIIQRYDLILILEIRDKTETAIIKLINHLNNAGTRYHMKISNRLGRTSSKEQYAFLYRDGSGIEPDTSFHYDDGSEEMKNDTFEREPFVVRFSIPNLPMKYIAFVAVHIDPDVVVPELISLTDVYQETRKQLNIENIIILGDMNADCSYLPKKKRTLIPIRSQPFYWPINDDMDTTVAKSECAYDRFIIAGPELIKLAKLGKSSVFRYDDAYGLTNTEAKAVSDHYPIELSLPVSLSNKIPTETKPPTSSANMISPLLKKLLKSDCGRKMLAIARLQMDSMYNLLEKYVNNNIGK